MNAIETHEVTYAEFATQASINTTFPILWVARGGGGRQALIGATDIVYQTYLWTQAEIDQFDADFAVRSPQQVGSFDEAVSVFAQTNQSRLAYPTVPDHFRIYSCEAEYGIFDVIDPATQTIDCTITIEHTCRLQGGKVYFKNMHKGERISIDILYPQAYVDANLVPGELVRSFATNVALKYFIDGWFFTREPGSYATLPSGYRLRFRLTRTAQSVTVGEMYVEVDVFEQLPLD